MVGQYYQITPIEAALVDSFQYTDANGITNTFIWSGLQTNGNYVLRQDLQQYLATKLSAIDFTSKTLYTIDQLNPFTLN